MPIISIDSLVININEKMSVMFWRIIFEKEEKVEKLSYVHSKETLKRLKPIRYYSNSEISKFVSCTFSVETKLFFNKGRSMTKGTAV